MPVQLVLGKPRFEDDVLTLGVAETRKAFSQTFEVGPLRAVVHEANTPNFPRPRRLHRQDSVAATIPITLAHQGELDAKFVTPVAYRLSRCPATAHSRLLYGTWRSSSATQQGSSVVEGSADPKTMMIVARSGSVIDPHRAHQQFALRQML